MHNFGVRNELKAHAQRELEKEAARMDAVIAIVAVAMLLGYAIGSWVFAGGAS